MISYIFKSAECLAFMFLLYHFLLKHEKMFVFNRVYLLFSIALSLLIPFVSYTLESPAETPLIASVKDATEAHAVMQRSFQQVGNENSFAPWIAVAAGMYFIITGYRLIKFGRNILFLLNQKRNTASLFYKEAKVHLVQETIPSYSFMNSIFISEADYNDEVVRQSLLSHEYSHVSQKHSWDVLLIELLDVFMWFNPLILLYKKAIRLNHEFLADAEAAAETDDIHSYQELLLQKASAGSHFRLSSHFNYPIIKKRLIMLHQTTSSLRAATKKILLIPFIIVAVLFFTTRIVAQKPPTIKVEDVYLTYVPYTKKGVSQKLMDQYIAILKRCKVRGKDDGLEIYDVNDSDQKTLESIFTKMNRKQQASVALSFSPPSAPPPPLPRITPTEAQLSAFKNANVYGVWINNKKVENVALNKYKPSDFSQVFISKLRGRAYKGTYTHQVDLMTNEFYKEYAQNTLEHEQMKMAVQRFKPAEQKKKNK